MATVTASLDIGIALIAELGFLRPICWGCHEPIALEAFAEHIESCGAVPAKAAAEFRAATARFKRHPAKAREVVSEFVERLRMAKLLADAQSEALRNPL
jgi:hypothetical protein